MDFLKPYIFLIQTVLMVCGGVLLFAGGYKYRDVEYQKYKSDVVQEKLQAEIAAQQESARITNKAVVEYANIETTAKQERLQNEAESKTVSLDKYRGVVNALSRLREQVAADYQIDKADYAATPSRSATTAILNIMQRKQDTLSVCLRELEEMASGTGRIVSECGGEYQELAKRATDDGVTIKACQSVIKSYE